MAEQEWVAGGVALQPAVEAVGAAGRFGDHVAGDTDIIRGRQAADRNGCGSGGGRNRESRDGRRRSVGRRRSQRGCNGGDLSRGETPQAAHTARVAVDGILDLGSAPASLLGGGEGAWQLAQLEA